MKLRPTCTQTNDPMPASIKQFETGNRFKSLIERFFPPRSRRAASMTAAAESLEPRTLLVSPLVSGTNEFVHESRDLYTISPNAADLGAPIVYLVKDSYDAGLFRDFFDADRISLNENDPDAGRGVSSLRATWDNTGVNGWYQLRFSGVNSPRGIPEYGNVSAVRFLAKGDTLGQQIVVNVFRKVAPSGFALHASQVINLTTNFADFVVPLPDIPPSQIHAVQFVIGDGRPSGNGEFWVDELRLNTDGVDPVRLPQSYRRGAWAPSNSDPVSPPGRDLKIYPNHAFLYDIGLGIQSLSHQGTRRDMEVARRITDSLLLTSLPDGSFYNELSGGHALTGEGNPKPPWSQRQTLGDQMWLGLALLQMFRQTGDSTYFDAAVKLSEWAENKLRVNDAFGGYLGGFDLIGNAVTWRSTEHNVDAFEMNRQLAEEAEKMGLPAAVTYKERSDHAAQFVMSMFDSTDGFFYTGTTTGTTINMSSVPLDAQVWSTLTLGVSEGYRDQIDWSRPLAWAEANLWRTDGGFSGFTFSSATIGNGVWFEGTAHAALAYLALGNAAKYRELIETLERAQATHPNGDGRGVVAASSDDLRDPDLSAVYDARLHVAASVWSRFAALGRNPFRLDLRADSIVARASSGTIVAAAPIGAQLTNHVLGGVPTNVDWDKFLKGDFDGDGLLDWAGRSPSDGFWRVLINNGAGFSAPQLWGRWSTAVSWGDLMVGDFDGDGNEDIAGRASTGTAVIGLSDGTSFVTKVMTGWSTLVDWRDMQAADLNGDGRDDVVSHASNGRWVAAIAQPDGTFGKQVWGSLSTNVTWHDVTASDFNGDGKADLATRASTGTWVVWISNGTRLIGSVWGGWTNALGYRDVRFGDFNGDGRTDLVGRTSGGLIVVGVATGTRFQMRIWSAVSSIVAWPQVVIGDFNLDGQQDLAMRAETGTWIVGLSDGTRFRFSVWGGWSPAVTWDNVAAGAYI